MTDKPLNVTFHQKIAATVRIAVVGLTIGLMVFSFWWISGPIIPADRLRKIDGGNKSDVLRIIGAPSNPINDDNWYYDRIGNPGWVAVSFDKDGRVIQINDESVFGGSYP